MRVLRRVTRGRQFAFVAVLTILVIFAGAIGVRYFDQGDPGSPIRTFGDALWWSSTLATTMNSELYVVTTESRVIGILQRLYALSVFGYITASIASYLIGADASTAIDTEQRSGKRHELEAIRAELAEMRRVLEERR